MSLMIEMTDIAVHGVSHRWTPASGTCDAYGILRFGTPARGVTVYFHQPAEIDEAIAELVALRAEMDPPVITGSAPAAHHGAHGDQDGGDFDGFYERVRTASADAARDMLYFIRGYCQEAAYAGLDHAVETGLLPAPVITDSERTCDQAHPETGAWCHRPVPHAEHRDTNGETWAAEPGGQGGVLFPAGDDEVTASEAEARGWCPATTFIEYDDVTLYCDRTAGHTGSHHAHGPDEGSEVAWSTVAPAPRRLAVAE